MKFAVMSKGDNTSNEIRSKIINYLKEFNNEFTEEESKKAENLLKVDPEVEKQQIEGLSKVKEKRNDKQVKQTLKAVREAAQSDKNLMYPIVEAVKAYATIGEISDVLREEFGEYEGQYI